MTSPTAQAETWREAADLLHKAATANYDVAVESVITTCELRAKAVEGEP